MLCDGGVSSQLKKTKNMLNIKEICLSFQIKIIFFLCSVPRTVCFVTAKARFGFPGI